MNDAARGRWRTGATRKSQAEEDSRQEADTFARIARSVPLQVAERYGYFPEREGAKPEEVLRVAVERKDFNAARTILDKMEEDARSGNGFPSK